MQTRELRGWFVCCLILYVTEYPVTGNSNLAIHGSDRDLRITRSEQTWAERLRDSGLTRSATNQLGSSAISKLSDAEKKTAAQEQYSFETDSQA